MNLLSVSPSSTILVRAVQFGLTSLATSLQALSTLLALSSVLSSAAVRVLSSALG